MRLSTSFALAGLACLVAFVIAPVAPAQPAISINFVATAGPNPGATLNSTEIAGAVPFANWNNASAANGTTNNLVTNTGATTAVSVTVSNSPNTWSIPANQLPNTPDGRMMGTSIRTLPP
jgi:hypothetical protein